MLKIFIPKISKVFILGLNIPKVLVPKVLRPSNTLKYTCINLKSLNLGNIIIHKRQKQGSANTYCTYYKYYICQYILQSTVF